MLQRGSTARGLFHLVSGAAACIAANGQARPCAAHGRNIPHPRGAAACVTRRRLIPRLSHVTADHPRGPRPGPVRLRRVRRQARAVTASSPPLPPRLSSPAAEPPLRRTPVRFSPLRVCVCVCVCAVRFPRLSSPPSCQFLASRRRGRLPDLERARGGPSCTRLVRGKGDSVPMSGGDARRRPAARTGPSPGRPALGAGSAPDPRHGPRAMSPRQALPGEAHPAHSAPSESLCPSRTIRVVHPFIFNQLDRPGLMHPARRGTSLAPVTSPPLL